MPNMLASHLLLLISVSTASRGLILISISRNVNIAIILAILSIAIDEVVQSWLINSMISFNIIGVFR
jgi:hypothetical protein